MRLNEFRRFYILDILRVFRFLKYLCMSMAHLVSSSLFTNEIRSNVAKDA